MESSHVERKVKVIVDEETQNLYITEAFKYGEHFQDNVTIVSGEMDKIKTAKTVLSLLSPNLLIPLLSTPCCVSPTLLLPDCSTISIQHLINIITTCLLYTSPSPRD